MQKYKAVFHVVEGDISYFQEPEYFDAESDEVAKLFAQQKLQYKGSMRVKCTLWGLFRVLQQEIVESVE